VVLTLVTAASAQCCFGAHHVGSSTASGDFRVEARSLGKIGAHGPYHFRFELFDRGAQDKWISRGAFEKKFATNAHFTMDVVPSETGNGVFVRGPGEKDLRLYDRQGQELMRFSDFGAGLSIRIVDRQSLDKGRDETRSVYSDGGIAGYRIRRSVKGPAGVGRLYLPLGLDLAPPTGRRSDDERLAWLSRMLHWTPEQGERQAQEVRKHLLALRGKGHEDAARALVTLGLSSLPAIDAALKAGDASERLREVRARIWTMLCGHRAPQDNLTLLAGILRTGDPRLVLHARSRLRAILPKETPIDGKLIFEHRRKLTKAITARRAKAERTRGALPGSKKKRDKGSQVYRDQRR